MSCAACSAKVEKAVSKVPGVTSCSVSLLTNSMGVDGTADPEAVVSAVKKAGYGAALKGASGTQQTFNDDSLDDKETPVLMKRLLFSLGFLVVLMYFSMGYVMWGFPLPQFFTQNPMAVGMVQLLLSLTVMYINRKFFVNGFKGLVHRSPNMDTLVAIGSGASFVYSTWVLFLMSDAMAHGDMHTAAHYLHELYFESAAMILALITVGKTLEARSKGKTTNALKGLMKLAPQTAVLERNGEEVTVGIGEVKIGDIFVVRPGEAIPVDGVVIEGSSAVNEAALTGESIPVDKEIGDSVSVATLNQSGFIKCRASRVGEDTTLSQIIKMVSDAAATKAPIAKIADTVSGVFVPIVIAIAVITTVIWILVGQSFGFALARGISVLVISCPCALGLATPVAIMVGNGIGAKSGILFKTAVSLEETGRVAIAALDKTGTITTGEPRVTDIVCGEGFDEKTLLELAFSLEKKSEHPLARAILIKAEEMGLTSREISDFTALPGNGLSAVLDGKKLCGGNLRFISGQADICDTVKDAADSLASAGKTPLFFAFDGKIAGIIAVADVIKEDSIRAVNELKKMGIRVVMLTGDNERTANAIGKTVGVDEVIAGVLPDGKESVVASLKKQGKVAMVGDGINDAPALTRADIGIAIGAGADVAVDAADIVLMKSALSDVPAAVRLSRWTLRTIHQNLFWAFFYNAVCIPLAAGAFIPLGISINPMFGAAAMSLSSFCVVTNALRLNLVKVYDASKDKPIKRHIEHKASVDGERVVTMKIEGMMCGHCEATVKQVLEAVDGVESAVPSHIEGTATVTLSKDVNYKKLKKAVEAEDYKVVEII